MNADTEKRLEELKNFLRELGEEEFILEIPLEKEPTDDEKTV